MKLVLTAVRFFVGGLFIFSGLIKVNDPVGTAIKMEEYFEIFSLDIAGFFHYLVPFSLAISIFLVVIEVVLGVALLVNFKQNWTLKSLLVIIVFFTALTGFSAITNSVTDCGCFGDAIKLTPWESFIKDLVLLAMILFLYLSQHDIQSKSAEKRSFFIVSATLILSLGLALYAVAHLPFIDFRAYKVGNHIPTEMKPSEDFVYEYVMEKDGKEYRFENYPTDKSYQFVAMNHLNPEAAPKITDFGVWNDDGDFTAEVFTGNKLFVILYDVSKTNETSITDINTLIQALGDQIEVYALTASDGTTFETFQKKVNLAIPYYYTDATVLKTITRSNPGLWLLQDGTVKGKWHYNDVPNYGELLDLVQ
ncbi:DoxX family protein [Reichenbachiella carrageenanivorans]|uniref:DoxX family protein n=1 Tax=Reichenbachiella carrageenanivorans TaxID=2979869 RepID=A0ABY6D735_9BACT|nr:BT_3928 family protein [Reichenbachiella carrageenanivorans]UXX80943.1 DoxX family protein [Reichenbachiella carrageenanivorans]